MPYVVFRTWLRSTQAAQTGAGWSSLIASVSLPGATSEDTQIALISSDYFLTLTGKALSIHPGTALVSERWWRSAVARNRSLADSVEVSGRKYAFAGVIPDSYSIEPLGTSVWIGVEDADHIFSSDVLTSPGYNTTSVLMRLRPGASPEQLKSELFEVSRTETPRARYLKTMTVKPIREVLVSSDVRATLILVLVVSCLAFATALVAAVGMSIVWSCDDASRVGMMRVLGSSGAHLFAAMVAAPVATAVVACGIAVATVLATLQLLQQFLPAGLLAWLVTDSRSQVLWLSALVASLAAFASILSGRGAMTLRSSGTASWLVLPAARSLATAAQIAAAVVLLSVLVAGVRGIWAITMADIGFDPSDLRYIRLRLSATEPGAIRASHEEVLRACQQQVGEPSCALSASVPLWWPGRNTMMLFEGTNGAVSSGPTGARPVVSAVSQEFFRVAKLRVDWVDGSAPGEWIAGRGVVIGGALASKLPNLARVYLNVDGGGQRMDAGLPVVGRSATVFGSGPKQVPTEDIYVALSSQPSRQVFVLARTSGRRASQLATDLQARSPLTSMPVQLFSASDLVARIAGSERLTVALVMPTALCAILGLLIGLSATIGSTVASRTHELAVREALGASLLNRLTLVTGRQLWLSLAGLSLGVFATILLRRWLSGYSWPVKPITSDVVTAAVLMASAVLFAGVVSLRRLVAIDLPEVLRQQTWR